MLNIERYRNVGTLYWDKVMAKTRCGPPINAWRSYMRGVYVRLARAWLQDLDSGRSLKTDLFEEAITDHHLLKDIGNGSVGIDNSFEVVRAARARLTAEGSQHPLIVGDLRELPLRSGTIKNILSGSSLDHFPEKADINESLAELERVLALGGTMVITFDNPHNPIVWLRNHLPFSWLNRLGLVPYYVGATCGRTEARERLEALGLVVTDVTAVAHAPRMPAIWLITIAERMNWTFLESVISRLLDRFEVMQRWPTSYLTGYYLAIRAEKVDRGIIE
jgi:SAM-dependent methyltransferase